MTPDKALQRLKDGSQRFKENKTLPKKESFSSFAAILTCIDCRLTLEAIFDQDFGSIIVTRVAGGVLSEDVIAGLEYATEIIGVKSQCLTHH